MGDICGTYYAREGSLAPLEMNQRSIAIGSEELLRVLNRVGVSSGAEKAASISAARASLINTLMTDENTASRMLDILDNESSANSEVQSGGS